MKLIHIVVLGSVFDGLQAYGPFEDYDKAAYWAEKAQTEWHAFELPVKTGAGPILVEYGGNPLTGFFVELHATLTDAVKQSAAYLQFLHQPD